MTGIDNSLTSEARVAELERQILQMNELIHEIKIQASGNDQPYALRLAQVRHAITRWEKTR